VIVREKGELYSKKVKGQERVRLAEVTNEVNRTGRRLRRAYFSQRLHGKMGDARAVWEVLGEVLGGKKKRGVRWGVGSLERKRWG
jgi:hypothetical protein